MMMTAVEAERRFGELSAAMEAMKTEIIAKVSEHEAEFRMQNAQLREQWEKHVATARDGAAVVQAVKEQQARQDNTSSGAAAMVASLDEAFMHEELMCMEERKPGEVDEVHERPIVTDIYSPPRVT